jgi:hypothetical protein
MCILFDEHLKNPVLAGGVLSEKPLGLMALSAGFLEVPGLTGGIPQMQVPAVGCAPLLGIQQVGRRLAGRGSAGMGCG